MQYIEAVSQEKALYPSVFLAGGITNCPEWQKEILPLLKDDLITVYNPRRDNFPMDDPTAAQKQITWEFDALEKADIFSMWFCTGESDQPICMYELGRHLALRAKKKPETVVIGIAPGYKRSQDVLIQTGLINKKLSSQISTDLNNHAANIKNALNAFVRKELFL